MNLRTTLGRLAMGVVLVGAGYGAGAVGMSAADDPGPAAVAAGLTDTVVAAPVAAPAGAAHFEARAITPEDAGKLKAAFDAFRNCMAAQGIELPAAPPVPVDGTEQLGIVMHVERADIPADPAFRGAEGACRSHLPGLPFVAEG